MTFGLLASTDFADARVITQALNDLISNTICRAPLGLVALFWLTAGGPDGVTLEPNSRHFVRRLICVAFIGITNIDHTFCAKVLRMSLS